MGFVRVHLARPLFVQTHEPLKVPKLVPRALGDLVELLGDDVVEVRQSVGSEEVIDDGELGRAGALLLGFILGRRLRIDVARVSGGPWGVPGGSLGVPGGSGGSLGAPSLIDKVSPSTIPAVLGPPNRYCKQYLKLITGYW